MRFILFLIPAFISLSAQGAIDCKAKLRKNGIAIEAELKISKIDGEYTVLSTEIQDRSFIVTYNSSKRTYLFSVSDYKNNQNYQTILENVSPEQEESGVLLDNSSLNLNDTDDVLGTTLACFKKSN